MKTCLPVESGTNLLTRNLNGLFITYEKNLTFPFVTLRINGYRKIGYYDTAGRGCGYLYISQLELSYHQCIQESLTLSTFSIIYVCMYVALIL